MGAECVSTRRPNGLQGVAVAKKSKEFKIYFEVPKLHTCVKSLNFILNSLVLDKMLVKKCKEKICVL